MKKTILGYLLLFQLLLPIEANAAEPALILHDFFYASNNTFSGYPYGIVPNPTYIRDNLNFLKSQPFDGMTVYMRKPDLSDNISATVMTATPVSAAIIASVLNPLSGLQFGSLSDNFAIVFSNRPADFFDDWSVTIQNFANLARELKAHGFRGIFFDNEQYNTWADYCYPCTTNSYNKTKEEYQVQARLRGKQIMQAMIAEFPDIIVISMHGPYVSEPSVPEPLFNAGLSSGNELMGPFFAGFLEATIGTQALSVDGGELYHYREASEFSASYTWRRNTLPLVANNSFIPSGFSLSWATKSSVGFGLYDTTIGSVSMNSDIMKTTLSRALQQADDFVWLYPESRTFLQPESNGGASSGWVTAIREGKNMSTPTPPPLPNPSASRPISTPSPTPGTSISGGSGLSSASSSVTPGISTIMPNTQTLQSLRVRLEALQKQVYALLLLLLSRLQNGE